MSQQQTLARKYAKGLYAAAPVDSLAAIRDLLLTLRAVITSSTDVVTAIKNPAISDPNKCAVLLALLERCAADQGLNPSSTECSLSANLLRVLIANKRATVFTDVASEFEAIVARHLKLSKIEISSARKVDAPERSQYEATLRQLLGAQTQVSFHEDAELLGGMQVKAGDLLIDGSVRTSLAQLRAALIG
jgi:F-type H+-transporting ATPase subunit delta